MATKLEYLKKYLAKPGEAEGDASRLSMGSDAARPKEKKKKRKGMTSQDTMQIRDLSEALPKPRALGETQYVGKQAKLMSLQLDEDEARLARDGDLEYVEADEVEAKSKIDVERSGVAWKIQNHRKPNKQALRAPLATKAEVVKEVKNEEASDSDMSPARPPARGRDAGDIWPPRNGAKQAQAAAGDDLSPPRAQPQPKAKADLSPPRRPAAAKTMAKRVTKQDSDADLSPPRHGAAPAKKPDGSDDDLSPPRAPVAATRTRHDSDDDLSPPRQGAPKQAATKAPEPDGDLSPPRGRKAAPEVKAEPDADLSPPRRNAGAQRQRHDSDADLSPPRKSNAASSGGAAKRQRHDSDADLSPPRRGKPPADVKQEADADLSPPRKDNATSRGGGSKKQRHDSDADLSPPRRGKPAAEVKRERHDSDADLSPPRKGGATAAKNDSSRRQRHDSDADMSPPRRATGSRGEAPKRARHDSDADMSPPRRGGKARHDSDADLSPPRKGKDDDDDTEKMSSGLRAGLVSGQKLREEAAKVREERKAALAAAPDHETGKGADTVYRNRAGQKIDREEWVDQQQKKRKKRMSEYPEQQLEWGGGLKQASNAEEEKQETLRIAAQPFARFEPDAGAIEALQNRQSWHDPMSKFKDDEEALGPASSSAAPAVKKPKCPHPPWPNRFGILPGYRWDGAVRGNNYEKRWLEAKNNRAFMKTEQYKWERLED